MVRYAERQEVENFNLYHEDNAGDQFIVAVRDDQIVGFSQFDEGYTDATIHFIEAQDSGKGIGSEMIEWFKSNFLDLTTTNTNPHCQKFLEKRGFEVIEKDFYKNATMKWWQQ